jgi:hypothetical protein
MFGRTFDAFVTNGLGVTAVAVGPKGASFAARTSTARCGMWNKAPEQVGPPHLYRYLLRRSPNRPGTARLVPRGSRSGARVAWGERNVAAEPYTVPDWARDVYQDYAHIWRDVRLLGEIPGKAPS